MFSTFPGTAFQRRGACLLAFVLLFFAFLNSYKGEIKLKLAMKQYGLDTNQRYVCVVQPGRLGNHMFQYASVFGISRKRRHTVLIPEDVDIALYFDLPSAKFVSDFGICERFNLLPEKTCCKYDPNITILDTNRNYRVGMYLQSWRYFEDHFSEVRQEFTFKHHIREWARYTIVSLKNARSISHNINTDDITTVGVHIRRTDMVMLRDLQDGFDVASERYIFKAMDYFQERYNHVLFIVCSDDMEYAKLLLYNRNATIEFFHLSAFQDLAVLSSCDHVIMTVGSFGWWAGFLSGGSVIYYNVRMREGTLQYREFSNADHFPPIWIGLD